MKTGRRATSRSSAAAGGWPPPCPATRSGPPSSGCPTRWAEVLRDGGVLLAEAGTGTGKTLAYLLPAVELGRRVVVSTGTKNLQEQLLQKDLPLLARALGRDLSVAVMKGRGNYLCLLRYRSFAQAGSFRRLDEIPIFRAVEDWAPRTATGDRAKSRTCPTAWTSGARSRPSSDNCIGQSCPDFQACWVTRMRQEALAADIVIVNHHLLCADLAVRDGSTFGEVIPEYDTVILDEAHLLEDVATQYFGTTVSSHKFDDLCRDVERELRAARLDAREVLAEVESLRLRADRLFKTALARPRPPAGPGVDGPAGGRGVVGAAEPARAGCARRSWPCRSGPEPLTGLAGRAQALATETAFVLRAEEDTHVYFVETRGRGVFLRATPIDVSAAAARAAVRAGARGGVDLGHAGRGRRLPVPEGPAGPARRP